MSAPPDHRLERLSEMQQAIEHLAEIQSHIAEGHVSEGVTPDWWTARHDAGLVKSIRLLAIGAGTLIEDIQDWIGIAQEAGGGQ